MPYFDERGTRYKEKLESTKTSVRLVSGDQATVRALNQLVAGARSIAASRAAATVGAVPAEKFDDLWAAEREFVHAARQELGLTAWFPISALEDQSA
jgi:hypothetical protein